MSDQQMKRCDHPQLFALDIASQPKLIDSCVYCRAEAGEGAFHACINAAADIEEKLSRTDAELRKERSARVEAEKRAAEQYALRREALNERDKLANLVVEQNRRVAELESRPEVIAQLEDEKRVLAERVSVLESDLSAVTASSVEHAKTIDGLRAELARANEYADALLDAASKQEADLARARRMTLTGRQLSHMVDFIDGDHETELTIARYPEGNDEETGETMPEGLYCFLTEYPDEGRLYLPEDAESARSATHSADTGGKG